jgi:hypothetical protein
MDGTGGNNSTIRYTVAGRGNAMREQGADRERVLVSKGS